MKKFLLIISILFTIQAASAEGIFEVQTPQDLPVFSDIENHWAENYILEMAELEIIEGYFDNSFKPNQSITRAELTKLVLEAFDLYSPNTDPSSYDIYSTWEILFSDVEHGMWYNPYIRKALEFGLISGYEDNTFRPNQVITRAEAAKLILSAADIETKEYISPFLDLVDWQIPWVTTAYRYKIINGINVDEFGPNYPLLRGETCKIISNTLKSI